MSGWITDTPASGRFQVSTRANADTVLPDLIRPLGATRSWQAAVMEGRRDGEVDHGAFEMAEPTAEGVDRAGGCLDGARVRVGGGAGTVTVR